jgi:hypothetical protein
MPQKLPVGGVRIFPTGRLTGKEPIYELKEKYTTDIVTYSFAVAGKRHQSLMLRQYDGGESDDSSNY